MKSRLNQRNENFLAGKIQLVKKFHGNLRAMNQIRKCMNDLCVNCRVKAVKNPRRPIEDYCKGCQPKIRKRIKTITKLIT